MELSVVLVLTAAAFGGLSDSAAIIEQTEEWNLWKEIHGKVYSNEIEELRHYVIWKGNKALVEERNQDADKFGYTLAMDKFSDLAYDEVTNMFKGLKMDALMLSNSMKLFKSSRDFKPLDKVDWHNKGAVTVVKNQGHCGSCWAFSSTGAIKGQYFRKTGNLVSLSEQNLIDCSRSFGNHGCRGGSPKKAFNYIRFNGGIDTEANYAYKAVEGTCHFSPKNVGATVTGYVSIPFGNESALMEAVTTVGPISVLIDANNTTFFHYSSGVYYNPLCSTELLDHAVLVVGYGTYNSLDYWLVKNSWSEDWGMDGYIIMARNKNNNCGIASYVSGVPDSLKKLI